MVVKLSRRTAAFAALTPSWEIGGHLQINRRSTVVHCSAAKLFPADVVCVETSPLPEGLPIHSVEAEAVVRANAKRRREFAVGRQLARTALSQLGFTDASIPVGPERGPVWPIGSVGSISHTDDYCVAVAALNPPYRSLGIDAEPAVPLEEALWAQVCTPAEMRWLEGQAPDARGLLCHILFTVKECVYKFQAPVSRTLLEFQDVEVILDPHSRNFTATVVRDGIPGFPHGTPLFGQTLVSDSLILAGIY